MSNCVIDLASTGVLKRYMVSIYYNNQNPVHFPFHI